MGKQLIISIGREFGSGGRAIATQIAADMGLTMYDRNVLEQVADQKKVQVTKLSGYDERPRNMLLSRTVRGFSNSIEENVAQMQFDFLRQRADSGESFVVLGRCSEVVLADRTGLISIFVLGDTEHKVQRVQARYHLSREQALLKMARHDRSRKAYHNAYSNYKWGDSRGYDLCINSSRMGIQETVLYLEQYIQQRARLMEETMSKVEG